MIRLQLTDLVTDVFTSDATRAERPMPVEIVTHRDDSVRTGTGSVD